MLEKWQESIFLAIINQDLEKLKRILAENENKKINFTDEEGNTPLHFASDRATEKTSSIIQFLLKSGCDPQAVNGRFETPLDRAKQNNNILAMTIMKHFITTQNQEIQDIYN